MEAAFLIGGEDMMGDNLESLKRQLEIHRRNLNSLEEQKASYGSLDVPLWLLNQIEFEKKEIARLEENIRIRIEIEVGPKAPDTVKKPISVEVIVAYIGLIGAVTVAVIGLVSVLGAPVITELAKSLFAPTATSVAVASSLTPTPTATTTPTPIPTATSTNTSTPTSTLTVTPTPTPKPDAVVVAHVNLRSGPGTEYDIMSTLSPGQALTVTGCITDATWLWVNTERQEGWVINRQDLVILNLPIEQIAIVSPPPAPIPAPPPPPSPTEDIRFWAESEHVSAGACTTIRWHVSNVDAYWVDGRPGMGDDGSKPVCPCSSQAYHLRAIKRDDSEVNLSVTINVSGQCLEEIPGPEPIIPPPTCLITTPADGDEELGFENEVWATCSDVPDSLYVWILVYSFHDYNYYPQPGPIGRGSGQWMGKAWLGWSTDGTGQWFNIIVALANEVVSGKLQQDVERCSEDRENCPGYKFELLGGVEEKARITVKRGHD
jgi:hypothetical protein